MLVLANAVETFADSFKKPHFKEFFNLIVNKRPL
jgi:hypothetical protein